MQMQLGMDFNRIAECLAAIPSNKDGRRWPASRAQHRIQAAPLTPIAQSSVKYWLVQGAPEHIATTSNSSHTGASAKATSISRPPKTSAASPVIHCRLLAYSSTIPRSKENLGKWRVASFCRAFPTLLPVDATTVTTIASHISAASWAVSGVYIWPKARAVG